MPPTKRRSRVLVVASLLFMGAQVLRGQNNPLSASAEQQSLRDVPNDNPTSAQNIRWDSSLTEIMEAVAKGVSGIPSTAPTPGKTPGNNDPSEFSKLKSTRETERFIFFFAENDTLEDLFTTLDNNYARIIKSFKVTLTNKIRVEVYPGIDSYHKRTFGEKTADWVVGNYDPIDKTLRMVSPNHPGSVHNYHSIIKVAVHEFTHCVTYALNGNGDMPDWLEEGLAVYYANQFENYDKQSIETAIKSNQIPTLNNLEDDFIKYNGYAFSYTIIDFIVKKYGEEKMMGFVKEPTSYNKIFLISKENLNEAWQQYLKEEYKK